MADDYERAAPILKQIQPLLQGRIQMWSPSC